MPIVILLLCACKTVPTPEKMPVSALEAGKIEGSGIHKVVLFYHLSVRNLETTPMTMAIQNTKTTINGMEIDPQHAVLKTGGAELSGMHATVTHWKTFEMELELHLDLNAYIEMEKNSIDEELSQAYDADTFTAGLMFDITYTYGSAEPLSDSVSAIKEFPRIREPVFTITSIAILQAELINTRFSVNLRIDNPNPFPLTLSSFKYELYGHNLYWADGIEKNVLAIPAKSAAETRLFLIMNFINMKRSLLDQIIAMRNVNYRFTGTADVGTDISWMPQFAIKFDRSGFSEVLR